MEGEHYVYLRKVSQKVFVLKTDREGELPGEEPDHYKAMEEEEGEGESQIWWRELKNRTNEREVHRQLLNYREIYVWIWIGLLSRLSMQQDLLNLINFIQSFFDLLCFILKKP